MFDFQKGDLLAASVVSGCRSTMSVCVNPMHKSNFQMIEFFLGITNQFILCKKDELSNLYILYIGFVEQFCQSQYFAIFPKSSRVLPNIGLGIGPCHLLHSYVLYIQSVSQMGHPVLWKVSPIYSIMFRIYIGNPYIQMLSHCLQYWTLESTMYRYHI